MKARAKTIAIVVTMASAMASCSLRAGRHNHPPTVRARCEPCTVEIGRVAAVIAEATDPDGNTLTYSWSAASGTLTSRTDRQSSWAAPMQEGPVPITVTVNDGRGGTATDAVTMQVTRR